MASLSQCSTVLGATSTPRTVARIPHPQPGTPAPDAPRYGALRAVQERAMRLGKGALARGTLAVSPGAATGDGGIKGVLWRVFGVNRLFC